LHRDPFSHYPVIFNQFRQHTDSQNADPLRIDGPTPMQVSGGQRDPGPLPSNELNAAASACPDAVPASVASLAVSSAGSNHHNTQNAWFMLEVIHELFIK
jgi:hypothetical protein